MKQVTSVQAMNHEAFRIKGINRNIKILSLISLLSVLFLLCFKTAGAAGFSDNPKQIEEKIKSVVMLSTYDKDNQPIATGSGFMAFDNMTVVTNYHVIEDASTIMVESDDGYLYFVKGILIADAEKDIAIIQLMTPTVMEPLGFGTDPINRGEPIVVVGSPQGLKNSVSTGIVSALYDDGEKWIQFTAPVSPGSSGGPVFNNDGLVIGMTTWNRIEGQNLNFALAISEVTDLYQQWDGQTTTIDAFEANSKEAEESGSNSIITIKPLTDVIYVKVGDEIDLNDYITIEPENGNKDLLIWEVNTKSKSHFVQKTFGFKTPHDLQVSISNGHFLLADNTGEIELKVYSKDNPAISARPQLCVIQQNGLCADIGFQFLEQKNDQMYWKFCILNPTNGTDTILMVEVCFYFSDSQGNIYGEPIKRGSIETINTGEVKELYFDRKTEELKMLNDERTNCIRFGISKILYANKSLVEYSFEDIVFDKSLKFK